MARIAGHTRALPRFPKGRRSRPALGMVISATLAAVPAAAFDPADMTGEERAAFGEAVRDYLLANPQIIYEMLGAIESESMAAGADADQSGIAAQADALFSSADDPMMGDPQGDVALVVFTDYRCPFCRATDADLLAMTQADPDLKIVVKHYPVLGPDSTVAAAFALAVLDLGGLEAHENAHSRLFGLRGGYTETSLGALARDLGLDPAAVFARMESDAVVERIEANLSLGRSFDLDVTPSFVLPGMLVRGQVPAEALGRYVAEVRARTKAP
jgi:protein-disulfide isomerase